MSLQDEMLEQNGLYQAAMQENEELKERVAALEQMVSEYEQLLEDEPLMDDGHGHTSDQYLAWETKRMELQQRAQALQQE